jgi:hypothetical protein
MYDFDDTADDFDEMAYKRAAEEKERIILEKHRALRQRHYDWLCSEYVRLKKLCGENVVLNNFGEPVYALDDWAKDNP